MSQKLNIDLGNLGFPNVNKESPVMQNGFEIVDISNFTFDSVELESKKTSTEKVYTLLSYFDGRCDPSDPKLIGPFRSLETAVKFMNREIVAIAKIRGTKKIQKCVPQGDEKFTYQIVSGDDYYVFVIFEKDIIVD